MIRTANVIESEIKIRSIPVEHLRFMGVRDAAHANLAGGSSQQGHLIFAVHASITNCRVPVSVLSWQSKKNQESCPQLFGCRDMQHVDLPGTYRLDTDDVGTDDPQ